MKLSTYNSKRNFRSTSEPKGSKAKSKGKHIFVVQQHHATNLHYDFRLEMEGVLKSWAVPKGPSMNPADKRLAMMVEDHPYSYKDFEGTIPEGNYGAGNVIVWDKGYFHGLNADNEKSLLKELKAGDLKIFLEGEKLKGAFALVKMKGKGENTWLLIKKKDDYSTSKDILKKNKSVISGKPLKPRKKPESKSKSVHEVPVKKTIRKAKTEKSLTKSKNKLNAVSPMLAKLTDDPFDDPEWLFEIKYDGYRAISIVQHGAASMFSRNMNSLNKKFAPLVTELQLIPHDVILDGEVVAENKKGKADFQLLQNNEEKYEASTLKYYVFDLLTLGDHDLTGLPLVERKVLLKKLLQSSPKLSHVHFSEHVLEKGKSFYKKAAKKSLEGIMAKEIDGVYHAGRRSGTWLKIKVNNEQEMLILGFTEPGGSRKHFGSILLGYYDKGKLHYAGNCGTGFDDAMLASLYKKAKPHFTNRSPFGENVINKPVQWIRPKLVCEVRFTEWTRSGSLRHPVFLRLRDDKKPKEITHERPIKH